MGEIQILTEQQKLILDEVRKNNFLLSNFYFTGGTALSSFYLQHRYSDDLDFFSYKDLDRRIIFETVNNWGLNNQFKVEARFVEVVYIFMLKFKDGKTLKVDFAKYPYKQLAKTEAFDNISVDSLTDIAVNKLLTISQRTEIKDFVDLYFLLQQFSFWDLFEGVRKKFNTDPEPYILASDFLKIEDFDYLPRMIKPLELEALKQFYRDLAKKIGKEILK